MVFGKNGKFRKMRFNWCLENFHQTWTSIIARNRNIARNSPLHRILASNAWEDYGAD